MLQPIARLLFPVEGRALDRHHSFVVQYEEGKDVGLDMHTDNSDVTFNVRCLGAPRTTMRAPQRGLRAQRTARATAPCARAAGVPRA